MKEFSGPEFLPEEKELMISQIGELTSRLRKKGVLLFDKENTIRLLDNRSTKIKYRQEIREEARRFSALFSRSMKPLTYLALNLRFESKIIQTVRADSIIGTLDVPATMQHLRRNALRNNSVVCLEINRDYQTPEIKLLALVLLAISSYCNKLLSAQMPKDQILDSNTSKLLAGIQSYTSSLLQKRILKEIVPSAFEDIDKTDELFKEMYESIASGKIPSYFTLIFELLNKWRYYLWVLSSGLNADERTLRFYFLNPKKENTLFECWVFYSILSVLSENTMIKETDHSEGVATFKTIDQSVFIVYQNTFDSPWRDKGTALKEYPDITIKLGKRPVLVIDAKNSRHAPEKAAYPYRTRMESYLTSTDASIGVLIHSRADEREQKSITNNGREIIWTRLSPSSYDQDLREIKKLIKEKMTIALNNDYWFESFGEDPH